MCKRCALRVCWIGCVLSVRHTGGSVMSPDLASGAFCVGMILHCRVCRCGMVASGCLMYVFVRPLLNNLIKKVVYIVSMQRPGIQPPFRKKI